MPSYSKIALMLGLVMTLAACGGDKSESTQAPTSSDTSTQAAPTSPAQPAPSAQDESGKETVQASQPAKSDSNSQAESESKPEETNDKADSNIQAAALPPDAGQKRYDTTCKICHEQGLLNSPKLSDKASWQPRIAQGKEVLYEHSIKGFNKMPPQAVNGVSEEEVKAAVDYMIAKASS